MANIKTVKTALAKLPDEIANMESCGIMVINLSPGSIGGTLKLSLCPSGDFKDPSTRRYALYTMLKSLELGGKDELSTMQ